MVIFPGKVEEILRTVRPWFSALEQMLGQAEGPGIGLIPGEGGKEMGREFTPEGDRQQTD